jgi:hypothetical protein
MFETAVFTRALITIIIARKYMLFGFRVGRDEVESTVRRNNVCAPQQYDKKFTI